MHKVCCWYRAYRTGPLPSFQAETYGEVILLAVAHRGPLSLFAHASCYGRPKEEMNAHAAICCTRKRRYAKTTPAMCASPLRQRRRRSCERRAVCERQHPLCAREDQHAGASTGGRGRVLASGHL